VVVRLVDAGGIVDHHSLKFLFIIVHLVGDSMIIVSYHCTFFFAILVWRVWRYQRANTNPYIEEEQTTQWPKENVQKDKQRSTTHTHRTTDRVTRGW